MTTTSRLPANEVGARARLLVRVFGDLMIWRRPGARLARHAPKVSVVRDLRDICLRASARGYVRHLDPLFAASLPSSPGLSANFTGWPANQSAAAGLQGKNSVRWSMDDLGQPP